MCTTTSYCYTRTSVCNKKLKMKITNSWWISTTLKLLLVAALPTQVRAYKILAFPLPANSHVFGMSTVAVGLANQGHKVTFFIAENYRLNIPELTNRSEISVVRYRDTIDYDAIQERIVNEMLQSSSDIIQLMSSVRTCVQESCQRIAEDDDTLDKLEQEKFDVAVVDSSFSYCKYLVPHRLHIPWITYVVSINPFVVRVPWLPSFVPVQLSPFSDKMAFTDRLKNTADLFIMFFARKRYYAQVTHEVMEKFRRYGHFSSLDELASKSVLWLMISDDVLDYPRPMMPNMVSIAGLTVKRSTCKLTSDIKNFIDGAEKGVILVTFGSMVSTIPRDIVQKFSSAFRRLDGYRVIWRLNNSDDVTLPDNVMIAQWLPQSDILAHPSVKLFVTHCGINGQYEAVYHGVPMIGFPVLGDQFHNSRRLDHKGYGLSMNIQYFTADQLLDNIHKILEDKSYKERVVKASEIFRSQAQSPVERATFWIEHVCRFGGDHLRSAGNDLPLYSYLMLDVLAFLLVVLLVLVYMLYMLLKFILNKCCERRTSNNPNSLKKYD